MGDNFAGSDSVRRNFCIVKCSRFSFPQYAVHVGLVFQTTPIKAASWELGHTQRFPRGRSDLTALRGCTMFVAFIFLIPTSRMLSFNVGESSSANISLLVVQHFGGQTNFS